MCSKKPRGSAFTLTALRIPAARSMSALSSATLLLSSNALLFQTAGSVLSTTHAHNPRLATVRAVVCAICQNVAYVRRASAVKHFSDNHAGTSGNGAPVPIKLVGVLAQSDDLLSDVRELPTSLRVTPRVVLVTTLSTLDNMGTFLTCAEAAREMAAQHIAADCSASSADVTTTQFSFASMLLSSSASTDGNDARKTQQSYEANIIQERLVAECFGFAQLRPRLAATDNPPPVDDALDRLMGAYVAYFGKQLRLFSELGESVQSILTGAKTLKGSSDMIITRRASLAATLAIHLGASSSGAVAVGAMPVVSNEHLHDWCAFFLDAMDMDGPVDGADTSGDGTGDSTGAALAQLVSSDPVSRNPSLLVKCKMLEALARSLVTPLQRQQQQTRQLDFSTMELLLGDLGFLHFIARQISYTQLRRTTGAQAALLVNEESPLNCLSFTRDCRHKLTELVAKHGSRQAREAIVAANATLPRVLTLNGCDNYPDEIVALLYKDIVKDLSVDIDTFAELVPELRRVLTPAGGDKSNASGGGSVVGIEGGLRWQDIVDRPTNDGSHAGSKLGNPFPFCWKSEQLQYALQSVVEGAMRAAAERVGAATLACRIIDTAHHMMRSLAAGVYLSGGGPARCSDFVGTHAGLAGTKGRSFWFQGGVGLVSAMRNSKVSGMIGRDADLVFRAYPEAISDAMATWLLVCGPMYFMAMECQTPSPDDRVALAQQWMMHLFWFNHCRPAKNAATFRRVLGEQLDEYARRHCMTRTLSARFRFGVREARHCIAYVMYKTLFAGNLQLTSALRDDMGSLVPLLLREDVVAHFAMLVRFGPLSAQQGGRHLATMMENYALGHSNVNGGHGSGTEAKCLIWFATSRMFHFVAGFGGPSGATHYRGLTTSTTTTTAKTMTQALESGRRPTHMVYPHWESFHYMPSRVAAPDNVGNVALQNERNLARAIYTCLYGSGAERNVGAGDGSVGVGRVVVAAMGSGKTEVLLRLALRLHAGSGVLAIICPLVTTARQVVDRANALAPQSAALATQFYADATLVGLLAPGSAQLWHPCCVVVFTPEFAVGAGLLDTLAVHGKLTGVVLDDCHALLETGEDFRPSFAKLGDAIASAADKSPFPVPVLGTTGTLARRDEIAMHAALWPRRAPDAVKAIRVGNSIGANLWFRTVVVTNSSAAASDLRDASNLKAGLDAALVEEIVTPSLLLSRLSDVIVFVLTHNDVMRVTSALLNSPRVMQLFASVRGMSRALVDESTGSMALDTSIMADMASVTADGRPRVIVSTPKFESGVSLPGIGKSIIMEGSYGLASGLQQLGRAGRAGQPDAEGVVICHPIGGQERGAGRAHNTTRSINVLRELPLVFMGAQCIVRQLRTIYDAERSAGDDDDEDCRKCTPCFALHGVHPAVAKNRESPVDVADNDQSRSVKALGESGSGSSVLMSSDETSGSVGRRARADSATEHIAAMESATKSARVERTDASRDGTKVATSRNDASGGAASTVGAAIVDDKQLNSVVDDVAMDQQLNDFMATCESGETAAVTATTPKPVADEGGLYAQWRNEQVAKRQLEAANMGKSARLAPPPIVRAQPKYVVDLFQVKMLPGMMEPTPPCGRGCEFFMRFIVLQSALLRERRCIMSKCTLRDGHLLEACAYYERAICVKCGMTGCSTSSGGACSGALKIPAGAACFHCWINHKGTYKECVASRAINYVRPVFFAAVRHAGFDMRKMWTAMWAKSENRFEFLLNLIKEARMAPGKQDPFVPF